jgi:hypothetical protein
MKKLFCALTVLCLTALASAQTGNAFYPATNLTPAYAADTGAANVMVATPVPCPISLVTGSRFEVLPGHANTTTTPTLNICGLGAKTIVKFNAGALSANDILTTSIVDVIYDGTYMELENPQTATATGTVTNVGFTVNAGSTSGIFTVTGSPVTGTGTLNTNVLGTSGGIPYFSTTAILSSSALLTQYGVMFGGGGGNTPTASAQGALNMPLIGQGAANPIFSTVAYPTSCSAGGLVYGSTTTALSCNADTLMNASGLITTYDSLTTAGLGFPVILGLSDVTAQTTSQTTVNILASTPSAGQFKIDYYLDQNAVCATPGPGQVYATFNWTDASHAHSASTVPVNFLAALSTAGGYVQGTIPIYSATSSAVSYTTTVTACTTGSASYDLHASLSELK